MFSPAADKTIEEILNLRVALRRFAAAQTNPVVRFHVDCLDDGLATACGSREDSEFRKKLSEDVDRLADARRRRKAAAQRSARSKK